MKTIFITAFEGIEAKNLMRTTVLSSLLEEKTVRVVLLMKSAERVAYYKREFDDPRIIYEVVPYDRDARKGIDGLFAWLKFLLLRTGTTSRRRILAYEAKGTIGAYFSYRVGFLLNIICARRSVRRLARFLGLH